MIMLFWWIIMIYTFCGVGRVYSAYSATQETAIRTQIFTTNSYDYVSRPVEQTNIKVTLALIAIDELNLKGQSMKGAGWFTFEWEDSRLTWTPASYANIEDIFQTPSLIWKPELVVDNSIDDVGVITDTNLYLRINYLGNVTWEPPQLLEVHCEADITYFPYDQQKCSIDVLSWGYNVNEVTLEAGRSEIYLDDFEENGEWKVIKSKSELHNVTETKSTGLTEVFPKLTFYLYLERRTSFYNLNVMIPSVCTSLLVVLVFVVPDESGEKLSYVLTVFLSIAVILTLIADSMPPTSITVSVLGLYLACVLILAAIAVVLTVCIMIVAKRDGYMKRKSHFHVITWLAAKLTFHPYALSGFRREKIEPRNESDNNGPRNHDTDHGNHDIGHGQHDIGHGKHDVNHGHHAVGHGNHEPGHQNHENSPRVRDHRSHVLGHNLGHGSTEVGQRSPALSLRAHDNNGRVQAPLPGFCQAKDDLRRHSDDSGQGSNSIAQATEIHYDIIGDASDDSHGAAHSHIQWKEVAEVLDRFCFFVFLAVSILMNVCFIIALTAGGSLNEPE